MFETNNKEKEKDMIKRDKLGRFASTKRAVAKKTTKKTPAKKATKAPAKKASKKSK